MYVCIVYTVYLCTHSIVCFMHSFVPNSYAVHTTHVCIFDERYFARCGRYDAMPFKLILNAFEKRKKNREDENWNGYSKQTHHTMGGLHHWIYLSFSKHFYSF